MPPQALAGSAYARTAKDLDENMQLLGLDQVAKPKPKPKRNPKPSHTCSSATSAGAVFHMRLNVLKHACLLLGSGLGLGLGLGVGVGVGLG